MARGGNCCLLSYGCCLLVVGGVQLVDHTLAEGRKRLVQQQQERPGGRAEALLMESEEEVGRGQQGQGIDR